MNNGSIVLALFYNFPKPVNAILRIQVCFHGHTVVLKCLFITLLNEIFLWNFSPSGSPPVSPFFKIPLWLGFLFKDFFILVGRWRARERELRDLMRLVHLPGASSSQGAVRLLEGRNSTWVSLTGPFSAFFPGSLAWSWMGSRAASTQILKPTWDVAIISRGSPATPQHKPVPSALLHLVME